jgi:hypothetical protein
MLLTALSSFLSEADNKIPGTSGRIMDKLNEDEKMEVAEAAIRSVIFAMGPDIQAAFEGMGQLLLEISREVNQGV